MEEVLLGQLRLGLEGFVEPWFLFHCCLTAWKQKSSLKHCVAPFCKGWEKAGAAPAALQAGNETGTLAWFHFLFSCELLTSSCIFGLCVAVIDNLGPFVSAGCSRPIPTL